MARILTVAQQKGGAGKTTLAAHLAVAIAETGKTVAVVDIDPQASLSSWWEMRAELGLPAPSNGRGKGGLSVHRITGWRTANEVEKLARDHDVVVVDSPPHAETEAKIAVRVADLVLVPLQPSPMDFWATQATLDLAKAEKTDALLVLNRVPPRASLTEAMTVKIGEMGAKVAKAQIGNRVALAASLLEGKGVTEYQKRGTAAAEIKALAAEVMKG
ncbi:ParA family partition ATPase [Thalassobaculum litoreum]|uniref:Plasmid segregation oscillating ATPase ParF n=1 Tax=Thalassobaculum litoreum DSM 18839 TaxID=1123362 RepID=A0A8G2F4W2_9PROT|nr:ParA family partition ATPase [Thalassobaculum litoreum]SDG31679.1 plasmid segregation oscillating ATPase ParF [Thalassobaculum litoreum DSM 18839]